ncbi:hypothetical protein HOE04_03085 [archaeon]|jgi:hypothetical protein|nr:hypothetical protein [archaeon]
MKNKLVFLLKHDDYFNGVVKLAEKKGSKICYITLNKSCEYLNEKLNVSNFSEGKFYFIDGISPIIKKSGEVKGCDFINVSKGFASLMNHVKKALKNGYNTVILDSLSNVLTYSSLKKTCSFVDVLLDVVKKSGGSLIVFCNKSDEGRVGDSLCISNFKVYKQPSLLFGTRE